MWNLPWLHWLPLLLFWEDSCAWSEVSLYVHKKLKFLLWESVPGKGCRIIPLRSDADNYVRHGCVVKRKLTFLIVSPCEVRELLWCLSRVSFFTEKWKQSYGTTPRRFCNLKWQYGTNKKLTVHWEKLFLDFRQCNCSFYGFWLNRVRPLYPRMPWKTYMGA